MLLLNIRLLLSLPFTQQNYSLAVGCAAQEHTQIFMIHQAGIL